MTCPSSSSLMEKEPFVGSFNAIYIRNHVKLVEHKVSPRHNEERRIDD